jgi:hypothetical protein
MTEPTTEWVPPFITGRCDAAGCYGKTAYVTRAFLADGTSPTYNEACAGHGGHIASSYLHLNDSFVRATIERITT